MRRSRPLATAAVIAVSLAGAVRPLAAQDPSVAPADPAMTTPTEVQGSVDVGYRVRDVSGSMDSYRRFVDLSGGPRLVGFDLLVIEPSGQGLVDRFSLSGSAIGGDPFPSLQFSARRTRRYDLRASWRRSRLFDVAPVTPSSLDGFDTSVVTNAHGWDSLRHSASAGGYLQLTNRLRFLLDLNYGQRRGTATSTRSLDYLGAPSAWGSFARANPYAVSGPLHSRTTDVTGGLSYTRGPWVATYEAGYRSGEERIRFDGPNGSERSINRVDPVTAKESLSRLTWSQSEHTSAPLSRATAVYRPSARLEWRSEHYASGGHGPVELEAAFGGIARRDAAGSSVAPYALAVAATGTRSQSTQLVGQSVLYQFRPSVGLEASYHYSRFRSEGAASLDNVFTGTAVQGGRLATTGRQTTTWAIGLHTVEVRGLLFPFAHLSIRPGVVVAYRDVRATEGGAVNDGTTRRQRDVWPVLDVAYRPSSRFSIRGALQASTTDTSYTRVSPTQRSGGRLTARWVPRAGWVFEAAGSRLSAQLPDASYDSTTHTASATVWRDVSDRLRLNAGIDWQSFHDVGATSFVRGVAPLAAVPLRNHEHDRIWRAGAVVAATSRLELSSTLALDRVTGTNTIDNEPPLYGPASFPFVTAAVSYAAHRHGRFIADLQRVSLSQERLPSNDFRSTIVMVRYLRTF